MALIFGILLYATQLVLVLLYSNTFRRAIQIIGIVSIFHIALSSITQLFHIFNYPLIISLNIIFTVTLSYMLYKKGLGIVDDTSHSPKQLFSDFLHKLKKNWIFILALIIISVQLLSIHYFYSGPVQTVRGTVNVVDSSYPYPYFSDEWVMVSLVKYSISEHSLPMVNPLYFDIPYRNLLFIFPSVISEFFLVTGLDPLTLYHILSLFLALLIISSIYLVLRLFKVNPYISASVILFIPYITNSGNLPALWSMIPVSLAIPFLFLSLVSQRNEMHKWTIIYGLMTILIYPPLMVFVFPILLVDIFALLKRKDYKKIFHYSTIFVIPSIILFLSIYYLVLSRFGIEFGKIFTTYFIRKNLDPGIPALYIWNVLPKYIILPCIFGAFVIIKDKIFTILIPFVVGVLYWITYIYINKVIIIEYPRIVYITSIFVIIISGIGLEYLYQIYLKEYKKRGLIDNKVSNNMPIILISGFFFLIIILLIPSYASRTKWQNIDITFTDLNNNRYIAKPANPINRYLIADDLNLFKDIHNDTFISPPWKGLVISSATHNTSFDTKASIISSQYIIYNSLMQTSCEKKKATMLERHISYLYSEHLNCPEFEILGRSSEGLELYKLKK